MASIWVSPILTFYLIIIGCQIGDYSYFAASVDKKRGIRLPHRHGRLLRARLLHRPTKAEDAGCFK
ncbi:hypothetical protein M426DRAFT_222507 [Hypoxylon sp. CI-4A]|nr:hypothetical protein M426DRAFT_222507 [Hypoxylon sp. CI-4A]